MDIEGGFKMNEWRDLTVGEIVMGQGPISLVPNDSENCHVHGNVKTGVQILQKRDDLEMHPWML